MNLEEAKQKIVDKVFTLKDGWRLTSGKETLGGFEYFLKNDILPGVSVTFYSSDHPSYVHISLETRGPNRCTIYSSEEPDRVQIVRDIAFSLKRPETALDKEWVIELAESL